MHRPADSLSIDPIEGARPEGARGNRESTREDFEMPTALLAQVSFAESGAPQAIESLTDIMRLTGCTVEQAAEKLKRTLLEGLS